MKEIKVIPTWYKNTKFRSRLEARWAVFFDKLGMRWEYEPEGFDLDGVWYLPDFYLPEFGYAEVKHWGGDFKKAENFVEKTKESIWLCEGPPAARVYRLLYWEGPKDGGFVEAMEVVPCWDKGYDAHRFFYQPGYQEKDGSFSDDWCDCNPRYMEAVYAAQNYDFKTK